MTARVLVVDDEHHMRALLRTLLEIEEPTSIVLVGEASDGREALQVWRELRESGAPDVVVLDHRMPRTSGLEAAREILAERPEQIVVLFSAFLDDDLRREASLIGIAACVDKREAESLPGLIVELHGRRR